MWRRELGAMEGTILYVWGRQAGGKMKMCGNQNMGQLSIARTFANAPIKQEGCGMLGSSRRNCSGSVDRCVVADTEQEAVVTLRISKRLDHSTVHH